MTGSDKDGFLVVGIGASAGGIGALKTFFENVEADSGNAYVVILHLSPDYDSQLASVLQNISPIPVEQVKDKRTDIEPNHVYVIPPNRGLEITDGHLETVPMPDHTKRRAPVDLFFRTLAESRGTGAVSVVLTGTGPNGSMGIKRVKEMGGIVVVQDPDEAEYQDMPLNSIATGLVDYILPVAEIPRKINDYKERLGSIQVSADTEVSQDKDSEKALADLFIVLRTRTGHDFANYKRATVLRRIERRMNVHGKKTLADYLKFFRSDPNEAQALLKDLLISVTNFFRDKAGFDVVERDIMPKIFGKKKSKDVVRIWVAGCATGEEAYSFAMLCAEQVESRVDAPIIQIFATDIDEEAIAHARSGLYSESDVADVSLERLQRFFHKEGNNYRVRRSIRETVLFAVHNVIKDPPFSKLDLVSCRNLLIYLDGKVQDKVMETFHFALKPGGYLFLGSSESADGNSDLFVPVNKEKRLYQTRPVAARRIIPVPEPSVPRLGQNLGLRAAEFRSEELKVQERLSYTALHRRLLELYAPPSVVVDQNHDIVHLSEHAGRYLQMIGGEPSTNLLQLARPEIRLELRTALFQAAQRRATVNVPGLRVKTDDGIETINLIVRPVLQDDDPNRGTTLIIFEPAVETAAQKSESLIPDEPVARRLEEELVHTKAQLRATIEQYEIQHEELTASNEELQAMNEELRSSAEELETSKEELQSINEELTTVNQELKVKIEELSNINANFQNLINSVDIGVIFLDRSLRVNLFSPAAQRIFNLLPNDVGRPLSDITSQITYVDLSSDADNVIENLQTVEREVRALDGRAFMVRVLPYRTGEDRLNGVVITFFDVTERKTAEEAVFESRQRLRRMMNVSGVGVLTFNIDTGVLIDANDAFLQMTGYSKAQVERHELTWRTMTPPEFNEISLQQMAQLEETGLIGPYEKQYWRSDGSRAWMLFAGAKIGDGEVVEYCIDVDEWKKIEYALRESEERLRLVTESFIDYAIVAMDKDAIVKQWNPGAEAIFGFKSDEIIGRSADILFTPEDRASGQPEKERTMAVKKGRAADERWHIRKNGERFYASGIMAPLYTSEHELVGFAKIARDLTERVEGEKAIRNTGTLRRLITTQEDERKRISRDLHDHLGQQLTALRLKLESLKGNYGAEPAMIKAVDETQEMAKRIDDEVSFMTWVLRPTALDNLGLRNALGNFVNEWSKNYQIPAEFHSPRARNLRFPPETEINLYRIAQEALNNVLKHAKARKVDVMLEFGKRDLVLMIEDNGQGFDYRGIPRGKKKGGLGLVGMRERATMLGGTLEIETARSKGTTVIVRVPVTKHNPDE